MYETLIILSVLVNVILTVFNLIILKCTLKISNDNLDTVREYLDLIHDVESVMGNKK